MTVVRRRQQEKLKASLQVAAQLEKESLPLPSRPRTDVPELAGDLTDLEDAELMNQLVLLTRWADYSGAQLAVADVDEKFADALLQRLRAMSTVRASGAEKITVAKAEAESDPVMVEATDAKLEAYARRKLLQARHEAFERNAAVVSRELTRRVERDAPQRRVHRYGGGR